MSNRYRETAAEYRARIKAHGTKPKRAPVVMMAKPMPGGDDLSLLEVTCMKTARAHIDTELKRNPPPLHIQLPGMQSPSKAETRPGVTVGIDLGFEKRPFSEASDALRAMLPAPDAGAIRSFSYADDLKNLGTLAPKHHVEVVPKGVQRVPAKPQEAPRVEPGCFVRTNDTHPITALAVGKIYEVMAYDALSDDVQVQGDNGQPSWIVMAALEVVPAEAKPETPKPKWSVGDKAVWNGHGRCGRMTTGKAYQVLAVNAWGSLDVIDDNGKRDGWMADECFERVEQSDGLPPGWHQVSGVGRASEYVYGSDVWQPGVPSVDAIDGWRAFAANGKGAVHVNLPSREVAMCVALGIFIKPSNDPAFRFETTVDGNIMIRAVDEDDCASLALREYHRTRGGAA